MYAFLKYYSARGSIMVTNFHYVNVMEFNSVIVVLKRDEYFLRHYIPLCISRYTCDLSITLWKQIKSKITNDNNRSCDTMDIFIGRSFENWKALVCLICNENSKLYRRSDVITANRQHIVLEVDEDLNEYIAFKKKLNELTLGNNIEENHDGGDKRNLEK